MLSTERASVVRGALMNLQTRKLLSFFMNPTEFTTNVGVTWAKQQTLGGTSERMHYRGTSNLTFGLELHFNRVLYADHFRTAPPPVGGGALPQLSANELQQIAKAFENYRKFLLALAYPVGSARDVLKRSPPHALLIWPKTVAVRVVLTTLQLRDNLFANDGTPTQFTANCQFEEYRTYRLTSSEAGAMGLVRHGGGGGA